MRRQAAAALSAYYVVTGIWPIAHMASFEAVTGRKHDHWLVNMVGALAIANGVTLAVGLKRRPLGAETVALAVASALAFVAIDVTYVARRRIRPVYLGDAAVELPLAAAVLFGSER
jgi:hypothetical protein